MSDYYVGESRPPPLPPPRKTPLMSRLTGSKDEYESVTDSRYDSYDSVDTRPPLPSPKSNQTKPPPPLPKKGVLATDKPDVSHTESTPLSPSKLSMFSAVSSSLQGAFMSKKTPNISSQKTKRASSYDASPSPQPTVQSLTPPVTRKSLPPIPPVATDLTSPNDDDLDGQDYEDVDLSQGFPMEPHPSDGISLLQFINRNHDRFPVPFEVSLGFSACSEEASISEGERFIANFLKRSKVLTVEDDGKERYTIPLNTSFQFALLHDPNANKKEAMTGFVFKTAGDLMITRTLPKVVRARKAFRGVSPESSVTFNELLYVKEVVQNDGNRRYVKCIQASTGKEKQLHAECMGEFSTSPHDIREYLPNLLKHFQLPLKAVMCLGIDNEEDIPSHLVSAVVTVSNLRTEESLITTTVVDDSNDEDCVIPETKSIVLNDIPLSYDINVKQLQVTPLNAEKMIKQTEFILQNFNPATVFPYMANHSSSQLALMKSVRKDFNMHGIEMLPSKLIKSRQQEQNRSESTSTNSSAEILKINTQLHSLESRINSLEQTVSEVKHQFTVQSGTLSELQQQMLQLASRNQVQVISQSGFPPSAMPTLSEDDVIINQGFLATLGVEQMTDLLAVMNLSQYAETFQNEQISGELLLELSDDILEHELLVSSKIHRKRIMKLIQGEHSAESYLKGEGPYVKMVGKS